MTDVLRFHAPGPWLTRDLKECVLASDYDALAERLAEAERLLEQVPLPPAAITYERGVELLDQLQALAIQWKATADSASGVEK